VHAFQRRDARLERAGALRPCTSEPVRSKQHQAPTAVGGKQLTIRRQSSLLECKAGQELAS
jgi:hypothetical protein